MRKTHIIFSFILVLFMTSNPLRAENLNTLWQSSIGGRFEQPSATQLTQARRLFNRLLSGESGPGLRHAWAALGFEMVGFRPKDQAYIVIRERVNSRHRSGFKGRGFYVVFVDRPNGAALQSPHSFSDPDSADIAIKIMLESDIKAAAWNTAPIDDAGHKHYIYGAPNRLQENYLSAFTRAFLIDTPNGRLFQLHSFKQTATANRRTANANIIISADNNNLTTVIGQLGRCWKQQFPQKTWIHPLEITELGSNHNPIGHLMRSLGSDGFVHLEFSQEFSQSLLASTEQRERTIYCIDQQHGL